MDKIRITKKQAKRYILAHQCLLTPRILKGKQDILDFIKHVGCIQFDPLNIVGRNPELVLQSRVDSFKPEMLNQLLYEDRKLLDGWDKQMSIYSIEDWPFYRRYREADLKRLGDSSRPAVQILPQVRKELEERGPLSSIDLDFNQTVNWSWAPTSISRAALESMYFWGELIIHHKVNTRKVYDFAYKYLPESILPAPDPNPAEEEYHDWYVHRRIGGFGLLWNKGGDIWLGDSDIKSKERNAAIERLKKSGRIIEIEVEDINAPFYLRSEDIQSFENVIKGDDMPQKAAFVAPLDNLMWDRRLIEELFDFQYRWEVYKPVEQREYGYYVLPVLYGDRFIARFEPGSDKKSRTFIIKNWWWEKDVKLTKGIKVQLVRCVKQFMKFLDADQLVLEGNACELEWLKAEL